MSVQTKAELNFNAIESIVSSVRQSIRKVAQHYCEELNFEGLTADDLLVLVQMTSGPCTLAQLIDTTMLVLVDVEATIQHAQAVGLIKINSDNMVYPTESTQQVFKKIFPFAQKVNQAWREKLSSTTEQKNGLEQFLNMLQK